MIDLATEEVIPLDEAPAHLPRRNGKKTNLATIYRWKDPTREIPLETALVGGRRFTSVEALQRFVDRVTAAADAQAIESPSATSRESEEGIRRAESALEKSGI